MPAPPAAPEVYPATPVPECHPDRLYVVGRLFGLSPPPVETCRVLEIGCSNGGHLLAVAATLPNARFVGIDRSESQLQIGRRLAAAAGISNVEFRHADLLSFEPDPAAFDYVTAHGVYSWVPPDVRDRVLAVAKAALAPNGIGFASYNTYPGGRLREMFWDMFRFHTAGISDPAEKIGHVHGLAEFLLAGQTDATGLPAQLFRAEADRLRKIPFPGMIHYDDLWEANTPVYVTEFARHLSRHGLRYVAEADVPKMHEGRFPPAVAETLTNLRKSDLVRKEQYLDFLTLRRYRLSVFSHAETKQVSSPRPAAVPEFSIGLTGLPAFESRFEQAVVTELKEVSPVRIPFAELLTRSASRAEMPPKKINSAEFADFLLSLYLRGLVDFGFVRPRFVTGPSRQPTASPLARAQAMEGTWLSTLSLQTFDASAPDVRELVKLLDGTRDRAALADALGKRLSGLDDPLATVDKLLARLNEAGMRVA